jgi:hypothetical protein
MNITYYEYKKLKWNDRPPILKNVQPANYKEQPGVAEHPKRLSATTGI